MMDGLITPKNQMKLISEVEKAIRDEYKTYKTVRHYIEKWHEHRDNGINEWENFTISEKEDKDIDLNQTLHSMTGEIILKVAIDLGVDTPDFIPVILMFKNTLKSEFKTAYDTFTKACKQIESDPSFAVVLANSALESIIKEILKDKRIEKKTKRPETETLYKLANSIVKEFDLTDSDNPKEIKTIGSSLLAMCQSIEKLRSEKTVVHGKTEGDYLITDPIYAYLVVNSVATVGLFLNSYYKTKFPKVKSTKEDDDLPF